MYKLSFGKIDLVANIDSRYVATKKRETTKSIDAIRVSLIRIKNGMAFDSIFCSLSKWSCFDDFKLALLNEGLGDNLTLRLNWLFFNAGSVDERSLLQLVYSVWVELRSWQKFKFVVSLCECSDSKLFRAFFNSATFNFSSSSESFLISSKNIIKKLKKYFNSAV